MAVGVARPFQRLRTVEVRPGVHGRLAFVNARDQRSHELLAGGFSPAKLLQQLRHTELVGFFHRGAGSERLLGRRAFHFTNQTRDKIAGQAMAQLVMELSGRGILDLKMSRPSTRSS